LPQRRTKLKVRADSSRTQVDEALAKESKRIKERIDEVQAAFDIVQDDLQTE